jgi:hypothetical protein
VLSNLQHPPFAIARRAPEAPQRVKDGRQVLEALGNLASVIPHGKRA